MSKSWSTTNYTNTPINLGLTDLTNPITAGNGADSQLGGTGNVKGNYTVGGSINSLDGGAIDGSLNLASSALDRVSALSIEFLKATEKANVDALSFSERASNSALTYAKPEVTQQTDNSKLYVIIAVIVGAVLILRKGGLNFA